MQGFVGAPVDRFLARDRLRIPRRQQAEALAQREERLQLRRGVADAQRAPFPIELLAVFGRVVGVEQGGDAEVVLEGHGGRDLTPPMRLS